MSEDNLNQNHTAEGEELEALKARITELEGLVAEKDGELEPKDRRITELGEVLSDRENELTVLKQTIADLEAALAETRSSLARAVSSYRTMLVQANPDVLDELITGDTIEEIDQSLENARALIFRVKQGLEEEASRARIPAGAPQRTPPDLSALSPREKIQYAIGGKR